MGQFSWITQDTNEGIRNNGYEAKKRKAFMHDNNKNVWIEDDYEGYGVFGGKDFYQLLAEMNKVEGLTGKVDHDRSLGIDLAFSDKPHISPNLSRSRNWDWENRSPESDPNQGWGEEEDEYEEEFDEDEEY